MSSRASEDPADSGSGREEALENYEESDVAMPLLERRGTPRRSDSSLSGTASPSFLERFYFSALGYTFVSDSSWTRRVP